MRAEEAHGEGEDDGGEDAERERGGRPAPRDLQREAQHGPGQDPGQRRAAEAGPNPEQRVLDGEDPSHEAARGAERLQDHRFVETLVPRDAQRPRHHDEAAEHAQPRDQPHRERDLVQDRGHALQHLAHRDGGDVGEGGDHGGLDAVLVPLAHVRGGEVGGGSASERSRGEDDEEVGVEALPVHASQVDDPGRDRHPLDVEGQCGAEADVELPGDLLLHRDQRLPRRLLGGPPSPGDHRVVVGRLRRPREDVLAGEIPDVLPTRCRVGGDGHAVDGHEPRAHHGGEVGRDPAGVRRHEAGEGLRLVGLDVDEEERGRRAGAPVRELTPQAHLEHGDGDDQRHRQPERDQHRARLAAGPMEIRHALAPGQRTAAREPRERDDEPGGEGEQQEGRGEPPDEQAADLPGAGLPERERREPAHDDERGGPRPPAREPRLHRPSQDERRPHPADLEQRPQREQERDAHAHGEAAQHRPRGQDEVHRQRQEAGEERREDGLERAPEGGAGETSAEPEQGGLDEIDREHVAPPGAEALEDGDGRELLAHEGAHADGHADAAHHEGHEPGQAEVHGELVPEPAESRLGLRVGEDADGRVGQLPGERIAERPRVPSLGQPDERAIPDAAARPHERGAVQIFSRDEHPRPEGEDAERAIGLLGDHAADGEVEVADADPITDGQPEPRQERRVDERLAVSDEGGEGTVGIGDEAAVERVALLHGFQLDELDGGPRAGARLRHGHQLADPRDGDALSREPGDHRRRAGRERPSGADLDVRAQQRFRRACDGQREAVGEALHADEGGHAHGDADQEIDEVTVSPARLPPRHAEREQPATPHSGSLSPAEGERAG